MSNFIRPDDDALYEAYKQTDNKDTIIKLQEILIKAYSLLYM